MNLVSSLDIGSNSIKLLVVEVEDNGVAVARFDDMQITRLSEDLQKTGELSQSAMTRTIDGIRDLLLAAGVSHETPLSAIVTAPGRRAANGQEFVGQLERKLGVRATVVSGEREARLSLLATQRAFPSLDPLLLSDPGGASTEFGLVSDDEIQLSTSVDLGAVGLTEDSVHNDPPTVEEMAQIASACRRRFRELANQISSTSRGLETAVLVGGTATTLANLHLKQPTYVAERVHGHILSLDDVVSLRSSLAQMTLAERRAVPGLNPDRADIIVAGGLLIEAIFSAFEIGRIVVSDRGARWGLVWELVET